ncbi:hypothetical protein B0H14DRAFT_3134734 [Mycena olivaceomarginata]|nr:hypothetical protein B0H14DRAFT_3134734 [Mycena olivaceomarginata]
MVTSGNRGDHHAVSTCAQMSQIFGVDGFKLVRDFILDAQDGLVNTILYYFDQVFTPFHQARGPVTPIFKCSFEIAHHGRGIALRHGPHPPEFPTALFDKGDWVSQGKIWRDIPPHVKRVCDQDFVIPAVMAPKILPQDGLSVTSFLNFTVPLPATTIENLDVSMFFIVQSGVVPKYLRKLATSPKFLRKLVTTGTFLSSTTTTLNPRNVPNAPPTYR